MKYIDNYILSITDDIESHFIPYIKEILINIISKGILSVTQLSFNNITTATSSGNSICIIIKDLPVVYQIYPNKSLFLRIRQLCETLMDKYTDINSKYITKHVEFIDECQCISFEKINPINNFTFNHKNMSIAVIQNNKKIKQDILNGLKFLHAYQYSHGDPTIDNIGYNPITKNYVLFDYDKSSVSCRECDVERDIYIFNKSIISYTI